MAARSTFTVVSRIHAPEPAAASQRLAAVERELLARGHRVLALTSTCPQKGEDPAGLIVSRWPVLRARDGQLRGYLPYLSFDLPLLWRVMRRRRPAAFLVEPPPTTGAIMRILAGLLRRPYVMYAPDVWSQAAKSAGAAGVVVRALAALESFALRGAQHVIAVTDEAAEVLREMGARALSVVPNGVDTSLFSPEQQGPSPQELAEAGITGPYFIYAGTASEFQGADIFARAAAHLRDCQVLFIGQGSQWPLLQQLGARLAESPTAPTGGPSGGHGTPKTDPPFRPVVVLDQMTPAQVARWQAGALAALVSLRPDSGCETAYPTKVLSALASGIPVLYAGVGPARTDLADPLLGEAVEYDVAAVAAAMEKIAAGQSGAAGGASATPPSPAGAQEAARQYRHQWVRRHRSTTAVGRAVADILEEAAKLP